MNTYLPIRAQSECKSLIIGALALISWSFNELATLFLVVCGQSMGYSVDSW